ncbi:MAG: CBS domain-containing protein [bacterium]
MDLHFNINKNELNKDRKRELLGYIRSGNTHLLREALDMLHPAELCGIIRMFHDSEADELLGALDNSRLTSLFRFLCSDRAQRFRLLWRLPHERLAQLISEMSRRGLIELFEGLSESQTSALMSQLPPDAVRKAEPCLSRQVGMAALVTDDFMKVSEEISIAETLRIFRELRHSEDRPNKVYVVDAREKLMGTVDLHELLLAPEPANNIGSIIKECPLRFKADDDPSSAARTLIHYGIDNAPVTDSENRLTGVVTARAAYKFIDGEKEMWLDTSAGMTGALVEGDSEKPIALIPRAGNLLLIMFAAFAVSAALFAPLHQKGQFALLFSLAPLSVAVGRLYARFSMVIFQKRRFAKQMGINAQYGRFLTGVGAALIFAALVAACALLLDFGTKATAFAGLAPFAAAVAGMITGFVLFMISKTGGSFRAAVLNPAFLSIADLLGLLCLYGLFKFLI